MAEPPCRVRLLASGALAIPLPRRFWSSVHLFELLTEVPKEQLSSATVTKVNMVTLVTSPNGQTHETARCSRTSSPPHGSGCRSCMNWSATKRFDNDELAAPASAVAGRSFDELRSMLT